ncbi:hypothetical protein J6590_024646 [Homalodisca vitripennis]|nr:hypothetical protein J6590_024646 [Homalodisca vitripennis]
MFQFLLSAAVSAAEDAEATTSVVGEEPKQSETKDSTPKEDEQSTRSPEKRGLFRLTGVHGENFQPYNFVYPIPQQMAGYQQPSVNQQYDPRAAGVAGSPKYEQTYVKITPSVGYSAQPTYQQPIILPSASSPYSSPYVAPTTMILLMVPPHPGNPYGSLMLVPSNNIFPQYTPNHILPYQASSRVNVQLVPQFIPIPVKYGQTSSLPAAHYKGAEFLQKPQHVSQQYLSSQNSQSYQDQPGSSEEQDSQSTMSPNYGGRVRPLDQYVKG